ncbi:TPA: hypothetical protein ACM2VO_003202 [Legionella pneumophila]
MSTEEEFYLEFLASINKTEVLQLHYQEKTISFYNRQKIKISHTIDRTAHLGYNHIRQACSPFFK